MEAVNVPSLLFRDDTTYLNVDGYLSEPKKGIKDVGYSYIFKKMFINQP